MIKAVIFDMDGTLVQTEILKANSYAQAAAELSGGSIEESEVIDAFIDVVGRSRQEVAAHLLDRFGLEEAAEKRMSEYKVGLPWQAFVQVRLEKYHHMLEDPRILKDHLCPHNMALLKKVRKQTFPTGLATMSHCEQTQKILQILKIHELFDFIATGDDVEAGKPDPEIYLLVASQLRVEPRMCLVIEDSVNGIKAAVAAGMKCIAVTSKFTNTSVHQSQILDEKWIVNERKNLLEVAEQRISDFKEQE